MEIRVGIVIYEDATSAGDRAGTTRLASASAAHRQWCGLNFIGIFIEEVTVVKNDSHRYVWRVRCSPQSLLPPALDGGNVLALGPELASILHLGDGSWSVSLKRAVERGLVAVAEPHDL
jgi:hypothetical protein